jgi:thiamine-phosphate pyrophosphorylase
MHRRQPLPRLWLMTDERQGEALWTAVRKLPCGAGIVFRHYGLPRRKRAELFRKLRAIASRRGLTLVYAGSAKAAASLRAHGHHSRERSPASHSLIRTAAAHSLREVRAAERAGADLLFLSPAFQTRSHPRAKPLGPLRFMLLARQARVPVIALGGMDARSARRLGSAIYGWAGIDAWSG